MKSIALTFAVLLTGITVLHAEEQSVTFDGKIIPIELGAQQSNKTDKIESVTAATQPESQQQ
jgi:hypothetical protein